MHSWKTKGIAHTLMVLFLLSQIQLGTIYADNQVRLTQDKEQSIALLDKVETAVGTSLEKIDEKIGDQSISSRIEQKTKEITHHIKSTQEKISEETSRRDIKELLQETKKVIVLKVVSGVTPQTNIEENIPDEIAPTPEKKAQAKATIQESLETKSGDYSIIIKTKYNQTQALALFKKFDTNTKIEYLYSYASKNYFEVTIDENSLFKQEMLEDIENGDIPESFLGIEIVQPEVLSITSPHTPGHSLSSRNREDSPGPSPQGEGEEQLPLESPSTEGESGATAKQGELGETVDLTGEQLNLTWGIQKYLPEVYLEQLQEKSGANKIKVGVIDTGIDANHPDLQGKVSGGYDFVNDDNDASDDQGHGTHVAGTIGANINGQGIIGVNPYVELIPLKICNQNGFCPSYAVIKSLEYAKEHNLDIVNMSLGGRTNPQDNPICAGISSLHQSGTIVVAAAGNSNVNTNTFVPGGCQNTITVGAIDQNNQRASFSNYGNTVDISAPGVGIYSTYPNNQYQSLNGTSMAAPHVSGLVSVLKTIDPNLTTQEIKTLFQQHPQAVYTDPSKPIASAIDIPSLIASLNQEDLTPNPSPLEEKGEEETPPSISPLSGEGSNNDDAEIIPTLEFIENQVNYSQEPEEEGEIKDPETGNTGPLQIDFGDKNIQIQTENQNEIQIIDIEETVEDKKEYHYTPDIQYYDEQGNLISQEAFSRIHTDTNTPQDTNENTPQDDEEGILIEPTQIHTQVDLDHILTTPTQFEEYTPSEQDQPEEETPIHHIYLGGTQPQPGIEINHYNNTQDPTNQYEEIEIQNTTGTGITTQPTPKPLPSITIQSSITVDEDNLTAHYPLEGNTNDTGPNQLHATLHGAQPTTGKDGETQSAYYFDGINDKLEIPSSLYTSESTLCLSYKSTGTKAILSSYGNGVSFTLETGRIGMFNGVYHGMNFQLPLDDQFHHLCMKRSTNRVEIYLDGQTLGSTHFPYHSSSDTINIGQYGSRYFKGTIDNIRIYNRPLTPEEIKNLHENDSLQASIPLIEEDTYTFQLDLSHQPDGEITIYAKAQTQEQESNTISLTLTKDTYVLEAPTQFHTTNIQSNQASYSWTDTNHAPYNETKYTIKDQNDTIIQDNIEPDTGSYTETNLDYHSTYQRKICTTTSQGEECSPLLHFMTPYPEPEVRNEIVYPGGRVNIEMPISSYTVSDQYQIHSSGDRIISKMYGNTKYNILHIETNANQGKTTLHISERNSQYTKYIINIEIQLREHSITLHETDMITAGYSRNKTRIHYHNPEIARFGEYKGDRKIFGKKAGTTIIDVYKSSSSRYSGLLWQRFHVTVLPKPEPEEVHMSMNVGQQIRIAKQVRRGGDRNDGYELYASNPHSIEVKSYKSGVRIRGISSGQVTVYTKSPLGNYYTHIYHITIYPIPPRILKCEVPVGIDCESYWYENKEGYRRTTTQPGIVSLRNYRFFNWRGDKEEKLQIQTLNEGETQVYIYRGTDHVATVEVTVLPAIERIRLESRRFNIKEGEYKETRIISGGGDYRRHEYDEEKIHLDIDREIDPDTQEEYYTVGVHGRRPGKTYAVIRDKYNQTYGFHVTVKDVNLELRKYEFQLTPGEEEEVYFYEYYQGISKIEKNNDNIDIYLETDENDNKYLRIKAKKEGITIFQVEDAQGNTKTGKVTVGPGNTNPSPTPSPEEPTPSPEEPKTEEEKELEQFLEDLQNLSNGVQINSTNSVTTLEEYKTQVDQIVAKYQAKNFSDTKLSATITKVQDVKQIIQSGSSSKKDLYVEVLDYLVQGFNTLLSHDIQVEHFINELSTQSVGGIQFKITGKVDEVGVQYETTSGETKNKALEIQEDGVYIVAFHKGSNNFKPYYTIGSQINYYEQPLIANYSSNVGLASNDSITTNSYDSIYGQFVSFVTSFFYIKGYDKIGDEVVDMKDEYDDQISLVVSLFPGIGEGYDAWTLLSGEDPITGEELGDLGKALTVVGLMTGVGSGKAARDLVDEGLEKIGKELGMTIDEMKEVATDVIQEYKIDSLDDIVRLKDKLDIDVFLDTVRVSAVKLKVSSITARLVGKYKNLECVPFANDFRKSLDELGIEYDTVRLTSRTPKIHSEYAVDIFPTSGGEISQNGYHEAVRIGNIIYDNVHPKGISKEAFKLDLGVSNTYYRIIEGID